MNRLKINKYMKRMRATRRVIVRKKWGKLLVGMLVFFSCMQVLARFGVPQLQRFIASGAPNPPSQSSMVSESSDKDEGLK